MDEILTVDSVDIHDSLEAVSRLQKRLSRGRDPSAMTELVDYFLSSGSNRAARALLGLREPHSQVRAALWVRSSRTVGRQPWAGAGYFRKSFIIPSSSCQDFFDKLNECLHQRGKRLAALQLLAHVLNTQVSTVDCPCLTGYHGCTRASELALVHLPSQASWLYRMVDHPLFDSVMCQLKVSMQKLNTPSW